MKAYAIRDASIDKERDLAWLLYYEREDSFHIEICENVDEWEAPLILSSFVKRGRRALDPYWSLRWVEERIVPRDRQNLGLILKKNGLTQYDAHKLLVLADGKCAQDECFISPLKTDSLPQELRRRLAGTLSCVVPASDHTFLFFKEGLVESLSDTALLGLAQQLDHAVETNDLGTAPKERERLAKRVREYRSRLTELTVQPGGHGVTLAGDCHIPAEVLRDCAVPLPVTSEDFKAYLRQEIIDTAGAAERIGCTRQNIQDLVRRGKMKPVVTLRNNFLFLRSEL